MQWQLEESDIINRFLMRLLSLTALQEFEIAARDANHKLPATTIEFLQTVRTKEFPRENAFLTTHIAKLEDTYETVWYAPFLASAVLIGGVPAYEWARYLHDEFIKLTTDTAPYIRKQEQIRPTVVYESGQYSTIASQFHL